MTSPEIPAVLVSRFHGFHRQFFSSKNGPRNHIDSMDQYFMNTDWHVEPRIFLLQAFLFSLQQYVSYFVDASLYLLYSGGTATPHWKIPSILQRNIFFCFASSVEYNWRGTTDVIKISLLLISSNYRCLYSLCLVPWQFLKLFLTLALAPFLKLHCKV